MPKGLLALTTSSEVLLVSRMDPGMSAGFHSLPGTTLPSLLHRRSMFRMSAIITLSAKPGLPQKPALDVPPTLGWGEASCLHQHTHKHTAPAPVSLPLSLWTEES